MCKNRVTDNKPRDMWIVRVIAFTILGGVLFFLLGELFQPIWKGWNNYDTTYGFYEEPKDTIETVFLGTSSVVNGITPMELYEEYGFCAYNLATEQQPMLTSYYWLQEACRVHGDSLKNVVLDVSAIRMQAKQMTFNRKGLEGMRWSSVKWNAVREYTGDEGFETTLTYFLPLFAYHSRWTDLTRIDWDKGKEIPKVYVRGYNFETDNTLENYTIQNAPILNTVYSESDGAAKVDSVQMDYFLRIISFCSEHNLRLILIKTPAMNWNTALHDYVQKIAQTNQLEFLDFNYSPLHDELEFNFAFDHADNSHSNYYGAHKLTKWLGNYLAENCEVTDVRGIEKYSFLEAELAQYRREVMQTVERNRASDLLSYLECASTEDYILFLSARNDAAGALQQEDREALRGIGLNVLSQLQYCDSYIGVIDQGNVVYEAVQKEEDGAFLAENTKWAVDSTQEEGQSLACSALFDGEHTVSLESGGFSLGDTSSCVIDGIEYSSNTRGLNIVVYRKSNHQVVDAVTFDTHLTMSRPCYNGEAVVPSLGSQEAEADLGSLYGQFRYIQSKTEDCNSASKLEQELGEDDLLLFLKTYWNDEDKIIFLSVKDEASSSLTDESRDSFSALGLQELSDLKFRDSYLAIIENGNVVYEVRDHGDQPIVLDFMNLHLESGGMASGNRSSIQISGKEYSPSKRGINIVVYNKVTRLVVDTASFDTYAVAVAPETESADAAT